MECDVIQYIYPRKISFFFICSGYAYTTSLHASLLSVTFPKFLILSPSPYYWFTSMFKTIYGKNLNFSTSSLLLIFLLATGDTMFSQTSAVKMSAKSFTSHLLKELNRKSINTFIDHEIERSRLIAPELLSVIGESRISIFVFSNLEWNG